MVSRGIDAGSFAFSIVGMEMTGTNWHREDTGHDREDDRETSGMRTRRDAPHEHANAAGTSHHSNSTADLDWLRSEVAQFVMVLGLAALVLAFVFG